MQTRKNDLENVLKHQAKELEVIKEIKEQEGRVAQMESDGVRYDVVVKEVEHLNKLKNNLFKMTQKKQFFAFNMFKNQKRQISQNSLFKTSE